MSARPSKIEGALPAVWQGQTPETLPYRGSQRDHAIGKGTGRPTSNDTRKESGNKKGKERLQANLMRARKAAPGEPGRPPRRRCSNLRQMHNLIEGLEAGLETCSEAGSSQLVGGKKRKRTPANASEDAGDREDDRHVRHNPKPGLRGHKPSARFKQYIG